MILDGYLLRGLNGRVRLVTGHLCLELDQADVLKVAQHALPPGIQEGFAVPVRLFLRIGARILDISSSHPYRDLLCKPRHPFAISVRADSALFPSPRYRQLEQAFLRRHGIVLEETHDTNRFKS